MAGIYIHVPFCKSKCAYCNFFSLASEKKVIDYVDALKREIIARKDYLHDEKVETIYFGGGTPSLLPIKCVEEILVILHKNFNISSSPEITLEINPDTVEKNQLFQLKKLGVNRMSVGIQSFHDDDLKYLGRRHDSKHALQIIDDLKSVGFDKLTLDLIYGIPTLTEEKWNKNLDIFFDTEISHLSAYALTVEPKTILGQKIEKEILQNVDEETIIRHYETLIERTKENAFEHYEISNFAKEGCRSQHNSIYWNDIKYLGLGPSAHSYDGSSRQWNVANLTQYIDADFDADFDTDFDTDTDSGLYFEKEILTKDDKFNEYVMTSLRTSWGCNVKKITTDYGISYANHFLKNIKKYLDSGVMINRDDNFILTDKGMLFADGIAAELFVY
ncbi:MAG: radical SAM family heme chaperone HemW [Lentimicrobiaceae bacterium]|nr:radical SAM family heme chaperone HemW [Lentimicrobiaceae bacterium]